MKIVYIAGYEEPKERDRKPSAKEQLHRAAIESLAATRMRDRAKATKMFGPERERLKQLEAKLAELVGAEKLL